MLPVIQHPRRPGPRAVFRAGPCGSWCCRWEPGCVTRTVQLVRGQGYDVSDWTFERSCDDPSVDIHLRVAFRRRHEYTELESRLLARDGGYELVAVRHG